MSHSRYGGTLPATNLGWVAAFDLQWVVLDSRRIDPAQGSDNALRALIGEYISEGWTAESEPKFSFAFMNRAGQRILLQATPRDPHDTRLQSFNPHRG